MATTDEMDYGSWLCIDPADVTWSDEQIAPPVIDRVWGSAPCPHCGHVLDQDEHHLLGDTAALRCPSCGGGSWMPLHPLEESYVDATRHLCRVMEDGAEQEAARAAHLEAGAAWNEFISAARARHAAAPRRTITVTLPCLPSGWVRRELPEELPGDTDLSDADFDAAFTQALADRVAAELGAMVVDQLVLVSDSAADAELPTVRVEGRSRVNVSHPYLTVLGLETTPERLAEIAGVLWQRHAASEQTVTMALATLGVGREPRIRVALPGAAGFAREHFGKIIPELATTDPKLIAAALDDRMAADVQRTLRREMGMSVRCVVGSGSVPLVTGLLPELRPGGRLRGVPTQRLVESACRGWFLTKSGHDAIAALLAYLGLDGYLETDDDEDECCEAA